MPQTQVSCPRCRQPVSAMVEQLFDVTSDPESKKRLLGRVSNYIRCPQCKFEGPLATPIVYHDNDKELLLTYFPSELGMSVNDQEKLVGPLITQAMNKLPQEKRKGYLLRPQSFFTFQTLLEKILEKDGISKEMIDEQQKQLALIQRLMQTATASVRVDIINQEAAIINEKFFALFERVAQSAAASGQEQAVQAFATMQQELLENSEYGKKVSEQMGEVEQAMKTLQEAGNSLTREKLLEIFLDAPNDARLNALINLSRAGLDDKFFEMLSLQKAAATEQRATQLAELEVKLVSYIHKVDEMMQGQIQQAEQFIEALIAESDIAKATMENIDAFQSEITIHVLEEKLREAHETKQADRLQKLQTVLSVLQQASTPPEVEVINEMVEIAHDPAALGKFMEQNHHLLTNELSSMLGNLIQQVEQSGKDDSQTKEVLGRLHTVFNAVIGRAMRMNIANAD